MTATGESRRPAHPPLSIRSIWNTAYTLGRTIESQDSPRLTVNAWWQDAPGRLRSNPNGLGRNGLREHRERGKSLEGLTISWTILKVLGKPCAIPQTVVIVARGIRQPRGQTDR